MHAKFYYEAGKKAQELIEQAEYKPHPYIQIHGFVKDKVYRNQRVLMLGDDILIPMRNYFNYFQETGLLGVQIITPYFYRKFYPEKFPDPEYPSPSPTYWIGNNLRPLPLGTNRCWLVKNYEDGLSMRELLDGCSLKDDIVIVCFTFENMAYLNQFCFDHSIMVCERDYFRCHSCGEKWIDYNSDFFLPGINIYDKQRDSYYSMLLEDPRRKREFKLHKIKCIKCKTPLSEIPDWLIPILKGKPHPQYWMPTIINKFYNMYLMYGIDSMVEDFGLKKESECG